MISFAIVIKFPLKQKPKEDRKNPPHDSIAVALQLPKPGKLRPCQRLSCPWGCRPWAQPSANIQTAGRKSFLPRPGRPGQGEDDFSTISPGWHAGARSIPAGFCSDLSIQCRPEGSSEPLSVGKKVRNIHFHCCFKSFSVAGFGNSPGPGEAAAADVSRKEPGRPRGLFAK